MLVTTVKLKGRAEKRREIVQTLGGIMEQVCQRKGFLFGSSYQDMKDRNIFCLINEWETQQDLDDYLESKLFAALMGIRNILQETPEIKILIKDCTYDCEDSDNVQIQ